MRLCLYLISLSNDNFCALCIKSCTVNLTTLEQIPLNARVFLKIDSQACELKLWIFNAVGGNCFFVSQVKLRIVS